MLQRLAGRAPIETHISAVFAGTDTVWKLKKAARLPFVDFSTLAARLRFLRRELEVNRAAAPEIYRDLAAVVRGDDSALGLTEDPGARKPIEWVLRMALIPEADFFEAIVARGALTPELLDALGDAVAHSHAAAPVASAWDCAAVIEGNVNSARAAGLPAAQIEAWLHGARAASAKLTPWLALRASSRFVRRCHGDLHLGNLCLWNGKPTLFDALEFDEALATIDVGYDFAFLLMDLDFRMSREAANRVLNRYVGRIGDAALTRGLPLFLSMRAMIRAHVRAAAGRADEASRYMQAALAYLQPHPPVVVAIGGLQGTGKSTLARMLAPQLGAAPGALMLRSDEIRKRLCHVPPEQRLPVTAYTAAMNEAVNRELLTLARVAADGGHSVIADATFLDPDLRSAIARMQVAPFKGFWLQAPLSVLEERIAQRRRDASDATVDILRATASRDHGPVEWMVVDATDADRAVGAIRRHLRQTTE